MFCAGTVSEAVDPVVAEVHTQEGQPPGPGGVPGQLHQAVLLPHVHVSGQLAASHEQPEGGPVRALCQFKECPCRYNSSCYRCAVQ